ncbi:Type 1 glutamine amidotransferase-like domain-containing protein [Chelatococcus reniformis]|nr:Type 1 glutamine amidotransferase-like domain-containing protein [Chelatococcus reniformis]
MNALDNRPEDRERWRVGQLRKLEALGLTVRDLDLQDFFGAPNRLREALREHDMVWINGGNAFILRRAMKLSGMDAQIIDLLERDEIVYAGFSAAAVIISQSLRGLEAVDDPHDVPDGYPAEIEWNGLGILPFAIVVHYKSNHSESAAVEKEIEHYERLNIPYRTLRDGEVFVVRGGLGSIEKVG